MGRTSPGTTYRITAAGRLALESWLGQRSTPLQVESEGLLRVFLADRARLGDIRTSVGAMHEDALAALAQLATMARQWQAGEAPFPERGPTNAIAMRLVADLHRTITRWAEWADGAVDRIAEGAGSARGVAAEVYADVATEPR